MNTIVKSVSNVIWGIPLILAILTTGIYLTIRSGLVQLRWFKHAFHLISGRFDRPDHKGHITHFQALSTALSATIGTGNIAGVATAIAAGGPGAVFWMWISALFGMAVKFTSATLAVKYRKVTKDSVKGGPMYYIELGIREKYGWNFKWLAVFFALSTAIAAFGIGNMVQANSVADALSNLILGSNAAKSGLFTVRLVIGLILAFLTGLVIIGGIKRIASVASRLTPTMSVLYALGALTVLALNYHKLPGAIALIFRSAFTGEAARGAILGSFVLYTMRMGFARGVFSNEAGLGTAPMAHSAAKTNLPAREGLVAMLGPFIDTIVICTMTALVIVVSGLYSSGLDGAPLTAQSFAQHLSKYGQVLVSLSLALFAYSTLIGWYFYGEKGIEYLIPHPKVIFYYKLLWVVLIVVGAVASLQMVWNISDVFNGFMALPNLVALILLGGVAIEELKRYVSDPSNLKPVR
ncbi:MAG: sodium:alanine symporter family protein [Candidatus Hydrothermota bacterium]|nr:MAG: sodium:alanine symporter family protein [Candidatus Hydrothermae bacterium]